MYTLRVLLLAMTTALLTVVVSGTLARADEPLSSPIVDGTLLLKLRPGAQAAGFISSMAEDGITTIDSLPALGYTVLSVPKGQEISWAARLAASPFVEHVQPEYVYHVLVEPNDFFYVATEFQWNLRRINAPAAWDIATGASDAVIAIIDTGVDDRHEELVGKVVLKQDYVNEDNPFDGMGGHGTHVAGIAAAKTNNGTGTAGLSWGAKLMSIKVANHFGKAKDTDAANGIIFAADRGARIINLSFGGEDFSQLLQDAVDYAYSKGALVIAAAGNCADMSKFIEWECKTLNAPIYPAAGRNVLAVGAMEADNKRSTFSEHGSFVAVAAPGGDILSMLPNQQYARLWGTSMAAPHVSALANLIWSVNPTLTNSQVANIITSTTNDLGIPGKDDEFGYGLIDARRALLKAQLSVTPDEIGFMVAIGDSGTETRTLDVNTFAKPFSWSAIVSAGNAWLSVSPPSGTAPSSLTISATRGSLGTGRHDGSITVQVTGVENVTRVIPASLLVTGEFRKLFVPTIAKESAAGW